MTQDLAKKIPTRKLANGQDIPCIGMGTFGSDRFTPEEVATAVKGAIEVGYRLFDCAAVYGNEHLVGEVFADLIKSGAARREDLFITSKVWNDKHLEVESALNKSLQDLKVDYVDAYFVHWPFRNYHAPFAKPDDRNPDSKPFNVDEFMETWQQLEKAYNQGLIKNLGMSNMTIPKLEAVLPQCIIKPTVIQLELHPSFQQPELFDYCVAQSIQPVGFCPIGSPSRPERDRTATDISDIEIPELVEIANNHGVHPAIICLKWSVQKGAIPIPFAISKEHYTSNLLSTIEAPLPEEEMKILEKVDENCRLIKGQVFLWEHAKGWEDLWDLEGVIVK